MKSVVIFPYVSSLYSFVKHFNDFLSEYTLKYLCSFKESIYCDKDAGYTLDLPNLGIIVQGDVVKTLDFVDVLLIPDVELSKTGQEIVKDICIIAQEKQIKIIDLRYESINLIQAKVWENAKVLESNFTFVHEIATPIIYICELVENVGADILLPILTLLLEKQGMKTAAISTNKNFSFFGFFQYTKSFADKEVDFVTKTININAYIKSIESVYNPDVIVISIPGMPIKYNDFLYGDFGLNAYVMSQAAQADFMFCCSYYNQVPDEMADHISEYFKNKYEISINAILISNKYLDVTSSIEIGEAQTIPVPISEMNKLAYNLKSDVMIVNLHNDEQIRLMIEKIFN